MCRTGLQWNELPPEYGKYRSVHKRYMEWARKGVWPGILAHFSADYDGESIMIDATIARAHACSAGYEAGQGEREGLGYSKGGFTTKIHASVDALGNPLKILLTPGQRSDISQAAELIKGTAGANIMADKAYDCDAFLEQIEAQDCIQVIPPKKNRKVQRDVDYALYKERHLVECFFGKIKHFRRVFSRFDKTADCYVSFIAFAAALLWLK